MSGLQDCIHSLIVHEPYFMSSNHWTCCLQASLVAELHAGSTACTGACFTRHHDQALVVGLHKDGRLRSFETPGGAFVAATDAFRAQPCALVASPHAPHVLVLTRSADLHLHSAGSDF